QNEQDEHPAGTSANVFCFFVVVLGVVVGLKVVLLEGVGLDVEEVDLDVDGVGVLVM
ncbi:unnamed protein product, partial [Aphanomyces euteiches]